MNACENQNEIYASILSLAPLIYERITLGDEFPTKTDVISQIGQKFLVPLPKNDSIVSRETKLVQDTLKEAMVLRRSAEGAQGVYSIDDSSLMLKFDGDYVANILADRFFEKFGFIVPHYFALEANSTSELGKEIKEKIKALMSDTQHQEKAFSQLSLSSTIIGMSRIEGKTFTSLPIKVLENILHDKNILKVLGRMVFLDFFIGNTDRLTDENWNSGNFMYIENPQEGQLPIALIDHDYRLNRESVSGRKEKMEKLLDGQALLKQIVRRFLENIQKHRKLSQKVDSATVLKYFQQGIVGARNDLLTIFSREPHLVYEMLQLEGNKRFDGEAFFQLMNVVKKI